MLLCSSGQMLILSHSSHDWVWLHVRPTHHPICLLSGHCLSGYMDRAGPKKSKCIMLMAQLSVAASLPNLRLQMRMLLEFA